MNRFPGTSYLAEAGRFDLLEAPHQKAADRERKIDDEGRADLRNCQL